MTGGRGDTGLAPDPRRERLSIVAGEGGELRECTSCVVSTTQGSSASPRVLCLCHRPVLCGMHVWFFFRLLARPSKYWDIPPRGFEHISPLQFKAMQGALTTDGRGGYCANEVYVGGRTSWDFSCTYVPTLRNCTQCTLFCPPLTLGTGIGSKFPMVRDAVRV